jgi:hypothetical protein
MNINQITINKLSSIYKSQKSKFTKQQQAPIQAEFMRLGYILSTEALMYFNDDNYSQILTILSELTGADKIYKPFYVNSPGSYGYG